MNENVYKLPSEINIPDPVCKDAGLTLKWCGISEMSVYAFCKKEEAESGKSSLAPCESNIHHIKKDCILYDDEMRKLVHQTCGSFISPRQRIPEKDGHAWILSLSHEYRSTIRHCIENLQIAAIRSKHEKYTNWAEMFEDIEVLWHLCELLHLDVVPGEVVLPRLLEWIQFQSDDLEIKASEILSDSEMRGAEQRNIEYWDVVIKLLLQGRFEATRALLRLHSNAETSPYLEADFLLRTIPVYSVFSGLTISEFNSRWRSWKSTVRTKIKSAIFESQQKLSLIMNILAAEDLKGPVKELKPYCDRWYHLMISSLIFVDPTVKIYQLNDHAKMYIREMGEMGTLKHFDETILSIFDSDLSNVVKKLQALSDGGWSSVHLGNLLYLSSCYSKVKNPNGILLPNLEALFLDYAELLMSHPSMWQVGVRYLSQCTNGKVLLSTFLEKIPIENEKKALTLLSTTKEFGLTNVAQSICRMMSMRAIKDLDTGNALTWALKSNDCAFASNIADHYLRNYAMEGELECAHTLLQLQESNLPSGRLTFLAKYCEFHALYAEGALREAAALLIRLLDSKVSPKFFWVTLLSDALPLLLLPTSTPVFSQDDTTVLSACLEELCTDLAENPFEKSEFNKNHQVLRLAIARNLSKTLILESCAPPNDRVIKCYK